MRNIYIELYANLWIMQIINSCLGYLALLVGFSVKLSASRDGLWHLTGSKCFPIVFGLYHCSFSYQKYHCSSMFDFLGDSFYLKVWFRFTIVVMRSCQIVRQGDIILLFLCWRIKFKLKTSFDIIEQLHLKSKPITIRLCL